MMNIIQRKQEIDMKEDGWKKKTEKEKLSISNKRTKGQLNLLNWLMKSSFYLWYIFY